MRARERLCLRRADAKKRRLGLRVSLSPWTCRGKDAWGTTCEHALVHASSSFFPVVLCTSASYRSAVVVMYCSRRRSPSPCATGCFPVPLSGIANTCIYLPSTRCTGRYARGCVTESSRCDSWPGRRTGEGRSRGRRVSACMGLKLYTWAPKGDELGTQMRARFSTFSPGPLMSVLA